MRRRLYESVEALQADLDAWLHHYNHERPHLGFRNQGRRPWQTVGRSSSQFIRKTRRLRRQQSLRRRGLCTEQCSITN
jgi:hypothetical protein